MTKAGKHGILFVTPWLLSGGIERVIENSVPWLAARGYRCEVASWNIAPQLGGQPNPVLGALSAAEVPVHSLHAYGRLQLLQHAVRVAAIALRHGHRLLVGYELEGNIVALLAKRILLGRVRVMAQVHNSSRIYAEVGTSLRLVRMARRLYRDADRIVAVSESIRGDAMRFFEADASRVVTIYNSLPIGEIRQMAKQEVNPPGRVTPRFVVGCGRLVRMKGFSDLVRAFAVIRQSRPLRLILLGEGPERGRILEGARDHGVEDDVLMPGFVENPWSYFSRASAFVLSSLFGESFSMVLVEAMACGVPVIASRCEWGPEEILDGERCGLLYEPGDVAGLTEKLRLVLDEPAAIAPLTSAASRRAEEFSRDLVLPQLEGYLASLLHA